MHKIIVLLLILTLGSIDSLAQYPNHKLDQYPAEWNARWITHHEIDKSAYGLLHFRNTFDLAEKPEQFIVHVSGDNRYRLYVNGSEVCYGPQLGDLRHWRYETLDLAKFLKAGKNIIAAEVMNWGVERSYGIISFKTGFLLQGHTEAEQIINTGHDSPWKVWKNEGIFEKTVFWRGGGEIVGGFYASNPTDSVVAANYPWGWQELTFKDENWQTPEIIFSQPKLNAGAGHGWILQPRTTAMQTSQKEIITRIARTDLKGVDTNYQFGGKPLEIPANSKITVLLDQGYVTTGYPKLQLSKGNGAYVKVKYSEALYDADNLKGNRDDTEGKVIKGISDVYVMDGGEESIFQPLWIRTFRFVQLEVVTEDEPLLIDDFHNVYSATEFPVIASFKADDPIFQSVWELCWHSMKICAQDNLMSDAYYEQMQYVGDLRPHLKAWTALTGDLSYFKSALQQFNNSRLPDGNITSCYPLKATFVHPTYSLIWIDMIHDLMMLEGKQESITPYLGEIEETFEYYESLINSQGLVGKSQYHMFIDWYLPKGGNSAVNKDGNSAILTLNYAYSLKNAAEIFEWLGETSKASYYLGQSLKYAENARKLCFDEKRGLYADDPAHTFYDQRASILAILCDAHTKEESAQLMNKVLDRNTEFDSKANLFYYFYLFEAMAETGTGNFSEQLEPWQAMLDLGMSGTPEKRVEQNPRSEIHPWTSHPVHYYFTVVAGIKPTSPGFSSIEIRPNLGELKRLDVSYPTVRGNVELSVTLNDREEISGEILLPEGMQGTFTWKDVQLQLKPGKNVL